MNNKSCYLFGQKSLLIQCAEQLLSENYEIKAVVTDDPSIKAWARKNQIATFKSNLQDSLVDKGSVDYIFSISYLRQIPENILALANSRAINFHDGLLPQFAGLNVTTWALYNLKKQHGITWHEMIADIDQGNILSQVEIAIDERETALTLNAKCYAAGLVSFRDLIAKLQDGQLTGIPQTQGHFEFFGRCDRMPAMAVIDWSQSAEKIDALVRSLNYGDYPNRLNIPKLLFKNRIYYVRETKLVGGVVSSPGIVIEAGEWPVISTAAGNIKLVRLVDARGNRVDPTSDLVEGSILPALNDKQITKLESWDRQACKNESFWLSTLRRMSQLELPLVKMNPAATGYSYSSVDQQLAKEFLERIPVVSDTDLQALLVIFLGRLCDEVEFSLFFEFEFDDELKQLFYQSRVPVNFALEYSSNVTQLIQSCRRNIENASGRGGYELDFHLREPELVSEPVTSILLRGGNEDPVSSGADLIISVNAASRQLKWQFRNEVFPDETISRYIDLMSVFVENLASEHDKAVAEIGLLSNQAQQQGELWRAAFNNLKIDACIHHLFEAQVEARPKGDAVSFAGEEADYQTLNQRANQVAHYLIENGVRTGQLVAVLMDRSVDMVVAIFGILKCGASYLPIDPEYPRERIEFMLDDAQAIQVISESRYRPLITPNTISSLEIDIVSLGGYADYNPNLKVSPSSLAYMIYTSGSTGRPKGVLVEHRNVVNFFHGMDDVIQTQTGVWLAVTSISFDISVLELIWTLTRGFKVVLYADNQSGYPANYSSRHPEIDMKFSLFYWNVAENIDDYDSQPYRLLIESAKYADENEFEAVWTPERHFHAFGGLFPNPSVTCSALAMITKNVKLRAGSCVAPLHHPARIAEEWSVVDNFSNGRVGIAFASGWNANDFLLMPQNHKSAKTKLFENIEIVRRLWRGDAVTFDGPDGPVETMTLPRPQQKELPIWITTAGNPETFRMAGELGANILTHLLGQSIEGVAENINVYRQAYRDAGHEGDGYVTLLLHTLIGEDEEQIKALAREPMKRYLKSAMFLVKAAAWHFPTFKQFSEDTGRSLDEYFNNISDDNLDALLEFAFERYYKESGLFGSHERALAMVDSLKTIGVNEIGCLIDYGLETDTVLQQLPDLNELRKLAIKQTDKSRQKSPSISELINEHRVTHLQCTPSMASMLLEEEQSARALEKLEHLLVGGEALSVGLANDLKRRVKNRVTNMYGPTETTIWSTAQEITDDVKVVPIGKPICNTSVYILDKCQQIRPPGLTGEMFIGGQGVVHGYHNRDELSLERFLPDKFLTGNDNRMYRTGDLARYDAEGVVEFLGRVDNQVKMRGYRIELGEIESLLQRHNAVSEAVVVVSKSRAGDDRLVAYITTVPGMAPTISDLKNHLELYLPDFMIPAHYQTLEHFPLTPNAKLDRKALPELDATRINSSDYREPESEIARRVASIWSTVLEIAEPGMNDNFFWLGGHSLTAVQLAQSVRQSFGIDYPLQTIFSTPILDDMVNEIQTCLFAQVSDEELEQLLVELED